MQYPSVTSENFHAVKQRPNRNRKPRVKGLWHNCQGRRKIVRVSRVVVEFQNSLLMINKVQQNDDGGASQYILGDILANCILLQVCCNTYLEICRYQSEFHTGQ